MNNLIENDITNKLITIKNDLLNELSSCENCINIFLETSNSLYSFIHQLEKSQQLDMILPIKSIINSREFKPYSPLKIRQNVIYYISEEMREYESLKFLLDLIGKIGDNSTDLATIKSIDQDKIKNVIILKNDFMFVYNYTSAKLFKQKYVALFSDETSVVKKKNNSMLVLSKQIPDIVFHIKDKILFMLDPVQSERILNLDGLFKNSINTIYGGLKNKNIMSDKDFEVFIDKVKKNRNYIRRLHGIYANDLYKYLINDMNNDIGKIEEIINKHNLAVRINKNKKHILINNDTSITDVLHLLAYDFVTY